MASWIMVLVWICSFSYPAFRLYDKSCRQQRLCTFPPEEWFDDRLRLAGLNLKPQHRSKQNVRPLKARALCDIEPGKFNSGILTPWTLEEDFQLRYLRCPVDAYSVRVKACWEVEGSGIPNTACELHFRQSLKGGDGITLVSLQHPMFMPRQCDVNDLKVHSSGHPESVFTVEAVAASRGLEGPCVAIAMPDTLVELMLRGRWSDIILLQRWHTSACPAQVLFANWPPLQWKPQDVPLPVANTELTVESLDQLAQTVISWVPLLQGQAHPQAAAIEQDGERDVDLDLDADVLTSVSRVVATLKTWRDTLRGSQPKFFGRGQRMHEATKLLAYLRCAWSARSTHNLDQVLERAVLAVMPWPMSQGENRAANSTGCVRFLWADSSPDRFHDWLWAEQHYISSQDAVMRCFEAFQQVASWLKTPGVDAFQIPQPCENALQTLSSCLQHHVHCPVALGGGKKMTDLAQKGAALAHTFSLENPDWSQLLKYLQSFCSITTDLGTEAGLSHLRVTLQGLFPAWRDLDPMELDGEDLGDGPDADPYPPRPDVLLDRYFLENALPVMGLQHVVFNLLKEVHTTLPFWKPVFQDLKNVEALLNWKFRRNRFIATCLRGTPFASHEWRFENFTQGLYEARWHEVAKFVNKLLPLLGTLRACWDADKFESADFAEDNGAGALHEATGGSAGGFNPAALTTALRSPEFAVRVVLIARLEALPEDLAAWAERCPCHGKGSSQYHRAKLLRCHFGVPLCPMAGKRAPELAAGRMREVFDELAAQTLTELLADAPLPLSAESQGSIMQDFQTACQHVRLLLTTKLDHWSRLPWVLCGLAHSDEGVARDLAGEIRTRLQNAPEADLHHRLTRRFLQGALRDELCRFADGAAFADLSPEFRAAVAPLRFIPITETMHRRDTHAGPVVVSMHNRMVVLEKRIVAETSPGSSFFDSIAKQLTSARHLTAAPSRLGVQRHPLLVACEDKRGKAAVSAYLQKPLTAVIYRTDITSQYIDLSEARQTHNQFHQGNMKDMQAVLKQLAAPGEAAHGFEQLKQMMILEHFRFVGKPLAHSRPTLFSMPARSSLALQSLATFFDQPQAQQGRVASTASTGALEADGADDPSQDASRHFFSIVKAKPSANKRMFVHPGSGRSLASQHVAVALHVAATSTVPGIQESSCVHTCMFFTYAGDILIVHDQPRSRGQRHSDNVAILTSLGGSAAEVEDGLQTWSVKKEPSYMLPAASEPLNDMVTHMVRDGYLAEKGEFYVPEVDLRADTEALCEQGLFSCNDMGGFALTKKGMQMLSLRWCATSPSPACSIRDVDVMELTTYELHKKLEQTGFVWHPWPQSKKRRQAIAPYVPGNDKVWYSNLALPMNAYLIALLRAEDIISAGHR
ncbi:unnamed protein product [Symbiodinium sp. CCMP2592]|nr:unnamed protein product [Symbiodinium sp. CCMP2592]